MSAEATTIQRYAAVGDVIVTVKLNVRADPSRQAILRRRVLPEQRLRVSRLVEGEDYMGENGWFEEDGTGLFFWSGGARLVEPAGVPAQGAPAMRVNRRSDGTIRPLSNGELELVYGRFVYREGIGGAVTIEDNAFKQRLQNLSPARLVELGHRHLQVHAKAKAPFDKVFAAIDSSGLGDCILSCGGTFVPRHKGWDPKRELSSHSWGVAIDLNVAWNGYGVEPAQQGRMGSLRELVSLFAAEGFAWGGHFSGRDRDGMHFELARMDL